MKPIILSVFIACSTCFSVNAQVTMDKSDEGLLFMENGEKILFYQTEPKNYQGEYKRCNYIHPLWGLDGTVLTEDFPADHLHHRGIFWAWHQVWINGQRIGDPWTISDFEQNVSDTEFQSLNDGSGELKSEVFWKSNKWIKNGVKVPYLKENITITIHPRETDYRKIDFEISLCALEDKLTIGGSEDIKGYSGFSVRIVLPDDVIFTGPEGKIEPKVTPVESDGYINISGSMCRDGKNAGIVILDHPGNPGYPQLWILRNKNSMQNAVYPGNKVVPISTDKPLVLKYSLLVYSGKLGAEKIKKINKLFILGE